MKPISRAALARTAAILCMLAGLAAPVRAQTDTSAAAVDSAADPDTALNVPKHAPVEEAVGPEPEPIVGGFIIPIEGDVFYNPELKVLVSLPGNPPAGMVLLVDGYPETNPLKVADGLISSELRGLKPGVHTLTLLLFNERTEIIGKEETRFFVRLPEPVKKAVKGDYRQFGRVVSKIDWKGGEARGRILSQSELTLDTVTQKISSGQEELPVSQELEGVTEGTYNLKYKLVEASGKVLVRTDENRFRQPAHRITANVKYGPWVGLRAGDVYPQYNPLILTGTRVRGGEGALALVLGDKQFASLKVVSGESRREVPTYIAKYDTGSGGTRVDTVPGTFAQQLVAARLGFGGGPAFDLGITLMKTVDHVSSPEAMQLNNLLHGTRPAENLVPGADLRVGFWDGKIQLYGDWAFSLFTRDRSLGAFSVDSFDVIFNPADYEKVFVFNATTRGWQYLLQRSTSGSKPDVGGFVNVNSAYEAGFVTSIPLQGVVTETEFRYSHLGLEYHSEGNPFLGGNPGDGFTLIQKLLVLDNRLSLALELGDYLQDLGFTSQRQRSIKGEIRFMPGPYQPSFVIGGGRSNIAPEGDYPHQFRSGFLTFNTGAYHQFTLPDGKLHGSIIYAFTQDDFELLDTAQLPASVNRTNIINASAQYKPRYSDFIPKAGYTFTTNGIQQPLHNVNLGFLKSFSNNQVKLDATVMVGQYPISNDENDLSVGEGLTADYLLTSNQTFQLRERWIQYGDRKNVLVGANYELFF
jgi:hypothetical protein